VPIPNDDDHPARALDATLEPPGAMRIHYDSEGVRVASWRNVGIVYWGSRATIEPVRALGAVSAELIRKYERLSVVQIIPDGVGLPTDEARTSVLKLVELGAPSLACLMYVLGGDGFWASTMRSLLTNVHWVSQRPFVLRICANAQEVATWLPGFHGERTRVTLEPSALLAVLLRASGSPDGAASPAASPPPTARAR
jgi:hypothetical protein